MLIRFVAALVAAFWVSSGVAHSGHQLENFNAIDITNSKCCRTFSLVDPAGKTRRLEDFRGKVVILVFGYTNCPDVCPTTLSDLANLRRGLGPSAGDVQVLFVTLDPARDTGPVLQRYVSAFDPTFIGLRGDAGATAKTANDFRIIFQKESGPSADKYSVYHMSGSYVFDRTGKARLFVPTAKPKLLTADIKTLLSEQQ